MLKLKDQSSAKYQMLNKIRISILGDQALIVGTENDINDIYSIHDHVAPHCLHDMLSLCPHSDETFTFFRPGSILIMNKVILEVVFSDKIGELRNQLKFYRNDNSKPNFFPSDILPVHFWALQNASPNVCYLTINICINILTEVKTKSHNDTTGSFKIVWLTHVWDARHFMKSRVSKK